MNCLVRNLSKVYSSGFRLGPINLAIKPGEVIGLLGPNGAGKTTLIRLLLGALQANTGSVELCGVNVRERASSRRWIGYLDEEPIHYDWMKISWLARFYASYYPNWDNRRFLGHLRAFSLAQNLRLGHLSKGSRVRVGFALSLAHTPRLLLLDEPTSGLDPVVRVEILDTISGYVHDHPEASVLFSSHIVSDLERVCTRALMLGKGRIIADTPVNTAESFRHRAPAGSLEEAFNGTYSLPSDLIQGEKNAANYRQRSCRKPQNLDPVCSCVSNRNAAPHR